MKSVAMRIAVTLLQILYLPFRLLKVKKRVVIMSRQSDLPSRDIELLERALKERDSGVEVRVLCKTLGNGFKEKVSYCLHMILQMYMLVTSSVVVIDGYCIVVSILPHKDETSVIQMWHACAAVKQFGWQTVGKASGSDENTAVIMKMHKNYDYILAPSKATADHFCSAFGYSKEKIRYIGQPHLSELKNVETDVIKAMDREYPVLLKKKNVLYIPTFREGEQLPVRCLFEAVDTDRYNLIVRLHPLSIADDFPEGVIIADQFTTYDWMKRCDYIISDYSSLVVETAIMEKPLFIYAYDFERYEESTGFNIKLFDEEIGKYVFRDESLLMSTIGNDYDFFSLKCFKDKYIEIDEDSAISDLTDFIYSIL